MLNGHGDDIYSTDKRIVSNFSSNVYNRSDLSALENYLCEHIHTIHSYPDPTAQVLCQTISQKYNILPSQVCISNGATEAIYLIAQTFRNAQTSIIIPTFSEYEDACRIHNHQLSYIDSLEKLKADTQLVWLCNPNNPTGKIYDQDYLNRFIKQHPQTIFIIDQSYAAFSPQEILSASDATRHRNLILLHSLTKCYAIPGLRLGYFTSSTKLVEKIKRYSMPWSVNQLAQLAGNYLLKHLYYDYSDLLDDSQQLQKRLSMINNLEVMPSSMHYFLCRLKRGTASDLKTYLLEKHGMLIRDAANFRGLDKSFFRIATQKSIENKLLINAIKVWNR